MSKALIAGINQVATDKGLDREVIFQAIEAALISAYKRNFGPVANVTAEVDRVSGEMNVLTEREVVDEVVNLRTEVTEKEARKYVPLANVGDVVSIPDTPETFGRIAAQTAKQVILQRIREAERDTVYENFAHRVGEVITAQVRSIDALSGAVSLLLDDKHECLMMREDQIPTEKLRRGDYLKVYVVDVHKSTRGPVIKISRTHRNLLRRLMETEIPEVRDGKVEIKSIAREPGQRSKAAVQATVPGLDAVGSCVGMRGLRIQNIVNELSGEKIDVVEWNSDVAGFISNALSPAKVQTVLLDEGGSIKTATVVVPDRQLSLAIGKEGQNARLAAKLTGWRIDIKSDSEAREEGLDHVIADRMHAGTGRGGEDLLAQAERILREQGESTEDRLWRVAQKLTEGEPLSEEAPGLTGMDFRSFDELISGVDQAEEHAPSFGEAPFGVDEKMTAGAKETVADEWPSISEEQAPAVGESAFTVEEIKPTLPEELPQVITAAMLRARMAQRKEFALSDEEIVVPPELLAGYDAAAAKDAWVEEEGVAEAGPQKGKQKGKPASKAAKPEKKKASKKPKWHENQGDDEYRRIY